MTVPQSPSLVKDIVGLIARQRAAFGQQRVFLRGAGLVLGEILAPKQHRGSDLLRALGCVAEDWNAWYRLWAVEGRFQAELAFLGMVAESLQHVPAEALYVVGVDATSIPRDSAKLEGSGWLKCPRNPPFRVGIHRAQRFVQGAWLTPIVQGFSRAIPLAFQPAFTPKAPRRVYPDCKEYQAGLAFLHWLRASLSALQRPAQPILCLADGSYDRLEFWRGLPEGVSALVRTAKNRALCHLPPPPAPRGRPRKYGAAAPHPQDYLQAPAADWQSLTLLVRGHLREVQYQLAGPFLRKQLSEVPLFLIVVRGQTWAGGRRKPGFYLVNAVRDAAGGWQLPMPIETLLSWAWQRWELEVAHRELKSGIGLGDKQAWNPAASVRSVQWSAWVYGLLMLAGYRHYGAHQPQARHCAWQRSPRRYSLDTVREVCRAELETVSDFSWLYEPLPRNWLKMESALDALLARLTPSPSLHDPP